MTVLCKYSENLWLVRENEKINGKEDIEVFIPSPDAEEIAQLIEKKQFVLAARAQRQYEDFYAAKEQRPEFWLEFWIYNVPPHTPQDNSLQDPVFISIRHWCACLALVNEEFYLWKVIPNQGEGVE